MISVIVNVEKNALGLQTQRQDRGQHFNEQRRIQTITV